MVNKEERKEKRAMAYRKKRDTGFEKVRQELIRDMVGRGTLKPEEVTFDKPAKIVSYRQDGNVIEIVLRIQID